MIEYEVNVQVDDAIAAEYLAWLHGHIDEILALPGFVDAQLLRIEEPTTVGRSGYCVRYRLRDRDSLANYLDQHAGRMRAQALERFAGCFDANRRVLDAPDGFVRG